MPDIELKPCPFCGSKAAFKLQGVLNDSPYIDFDFKIECGYCRISLSEIFNIGMFFNEEGVIEFYKDERPRAINTWNRRADMDWISVKDRLPENGDYVLVFGDGNGGECFVGYYSNFGNSIYHWVRNNILYHYNVTHWMPLPEPPKGD